VSGPGAGTVLEVKEEKGFGTTLDVVLYDGTVREDETIVVGGKNEPIVTDVRALLKPRDLSEIRTEDRFENVPEIAAAAGAKIAAPDLDDAMAGAPVRVVRDRDIDEVVAEVQAELSDIEVATQEQGVVVKADTLGSLEAIANALDEAEIPVMRAEVGDVAPRDVSVASTAEEGKHQTILAFNVDVLADARRQAEDDDVNLFESDVIYRLIEEYEEHVEELERAQQETVLENITRPGRFQILPDHTFRQNDPAVVGVEVLAGTIRKNSYVAKFEGNEPKRVGELKGIQEQGEDVDEARRSDRVSVAIDGRRSAARSRRATSCGSRFRRSTQRFWSRNSPTTSRPTNWRRSTCISTSTASATHSGGSSPTKPATSAPRFYGTCNESLKRHCLSLVYRSSKDEINPFPYREIFRVSDGSIADLNGINVTNGTRL
jgi:translation initiation factor 5B